MSENEMMRRSPVSLEPQNQNRGTRDYNYKRTSTGNSKKVPVYSSAPAYDRSSPPDASEFRAQQQMKINLQNNNSGQGKASRTSAKCPPPATSSSQPNKPLPINDIRKSDKYPEQRSPPKLEKIIQQSQLPLTPKPQRPTVSFGAYPQPSGKEAFRPPTPVPFMHRVNSLPYVGVPEDDSTFFTDPQPTDNFDIQEPNFEESVFFSTQQTSRPCTPVYRNPPNPLFIPTIDLPDPSPVEFYSSGSSRQMSPSLRDRSPSLPLFIPRIPWYRKKQNQVLISLVILLIVILILFVL